MDLKSFHSSGYTFGYYVTLPNDPEFPKTFTLFRLFYSCRCSPHMYIWEEEGQGETSTQIALYDEILSWFSYPTVDVPSESSVWDSVGGVGGGREREGGKERDWETYKPGKPQDWSCGWESVYTFYLSSWGMGASWWSSPLIYTEGWIDNFFLGKFAAYFKQGNLGWGWKGKKALYFMY